MATVSHDSDWAPDFLHAFSPAERQQLLQEDLEAQRSVSLVLASVIGLGVIIAICAVTYTVLVKF
jgi:hypothetical protein